MWFVVWNMGWWFWWFGDRLLLPIRSREMCVTTAPAVGFNWNLLYLQPFQILRGTLSILFIILIAMQSNWITYKVWLHLLYSLRYTIYLDICKNFKFNVHSSQIWNLCEAKQWVLLSLLDNKSLQRIRIDKNDLTEYISIFITINCFFFVVRFKVLFNNWYLKFH